MESAVAALCNATLTRRQLLELGVVAWAAPHTLRGAVREPWSFVVCSDTHFGVGDNLAKNRALLEEIARLRPELVLNAGDVTERGWPEEYDDVDRAFAGLNLPVRHAPGNHDVRWAPLGLQIFAERVGPPHALLEHRGCLFLLLDTTVPLSHWGHVGGPQRRWLEHELERFASDTPLFVFLHHAPGRRPVVVDDEDALADILARFNTKVIFTGHGHSDLIWEWRGLTLTMGKGLYQGSYQRVEVDPERDEIRLHRRTADVPALTPFATRPLAARPRVHAASVPVPAMATEGVLKPRWTRALSGGVMSHLLLHRAVLYLSAMDGAVLALDAGDGRVRWRATTGGYCVSSPVVAGDVAVVGSADAHVYAFDVATGAERWRVATRGPVYASAAVAQGIAAIASGDGGVYGIGVADGAVRWQYSLPPGPSAFAQSPAATDGQRFFIGAWDRHVYALDAATGREAWRYAATPSSMYYSAAIAAPAVAGGRLFVPSNDNVLHALQPDTGAVLWTRTTTGDKFGYSSPAVVGDRLYIGCLGDRGEVRCLAVDDGRDVWVAATGATIYESSPAVAGRRIAIGSVDGTLWLLGADDGAILGSYRFPPGHFLSSPAAEPGRIYAATFAEVVMAFDVSARE
jgi:outer membrane protein assembly factor BamB